MPIEAGGVAETDGGGRKQANAGCGRITLFWSSKVRRPDISIRWITNITSGRPASYSSNTSATPCRSAHAVCRREFGNPLAVLDDRVLAEEIDTADVAVEIDTHARPVQARGDLLDVGRFAGAVKAGDHDAAIPGKTGENRERGGAVEAVIGIVIRDVRVSLRIGRHFEVRINAK